MREKARHNSRELVAAVLAGRRPARIPIFDLLLNDSVIEHFAGRPLDGVNDEQIIFQALNNSVDSTRCVFTPGVPGTTWIDEVGNTRIKQRWTSWIQKQAHSDAGAWEQWMRQYVERAEAGDDTLHRIALTEPDVDPQRRQRAAAEQRRITEALGGPVYIHCTPSTTLNTLINYIGLDMLCYLWADSRALVERWFRLYLRETLNYIEATAQPEYSPLAMIYCDIAYNHGPMFGQTMFHEMGFFDEVAAICDACHRRGMKVIFHSDGNISSIMADLSATGIDGLNPIETAAGMDVFQIHRDYPHLILVGGVDVTHLLRGGADDDIRRQTRRMIEEIGADGRLLIGSTTEIGDDIPLEKYLVFHEELFILPDSAARCFDSEEGPH